MLRTALTALVALALAVPAAAQDRAPGDPRTLSVTGHGEASAEPDMATIRIGVENQAESPTAALEQNNAEVEQVIAAIEAAGVAPKDIQTANFAVRPVYSHVRPEETEQPRVVAFRVSNEVVARIREIDGFGEVLASVVEAGANQINHLVFGIEDESALRAEARRKAMQDARQVAELYAEAAGVSLGPVLSIDERQQGPMPVESRMMALESADAGAVPIRRGETTLSATVDVAWEIQPSE